MATKTQSFSWRSKSVVENKAECEFAIENFSKGKWKNGTWVQSSEFKSGDGETEQKWCVFAYPNGEEEEEVGYLSLYLTNVNSKEDNEVNYDLWLCGPNAKKYQVYSTHYVFTKGDPGHGLAKFVSLAALKKDAAELLPGDRLTIGCRVTHRLTVTFNEGGAKRLCDRSEELGELQSLRSLRESAEFSDVTITASGTVFKAHKCVLAARSPVLAAMFRPKQQRGRKRKRQPVQLPCGDVEASDVDAADMERFLAAIYAPGSVDVETNTRGLLHLADKYGVSYLKSLCEDTLIETLSQENVAELLLLAHTHNAENLKKLAMDYIIRHRKEVTATAGWAAAKTANGALLSQVMLDAVERAQ